MWSRIGGAERLVLLDKAVEFTGDAELYGSWMLKVIKAWPVSCEHNLTDYGMNRKAWTGHAACCLALSIPEDITRSAWGRLTQLQQDQANAKAGEAIHAWEQWYAGQNSTVHIDMDSEGIPEWDTGRGGFCFGVAGQSAILSSDMQSHYEE